MHWGSFHLIYNMKHRTDALLLATRSVGDLGCLCYIEIQTVRYVPMVCRLFNDIYLKLFEMQVYVLMLNE